MGNTWIIIIRVFLCEADADVSNRNLCCGGKKTIEEESAVKQDAAVGEKHLDDNNNKRFLCEADADVDVSIREFVL